MSQTPKFDLATPEGGRGYLAQLFNDPLKQHDLTWRQAIDSVAQVITNTGKSISRRKP
ncbi:hypothetical protein K5D56_21565 [Pseudomonas cichorii]|nr:hypothetical protein [Pseudomonas cichorii]MBX8557056.1 hypothetical protein [Pseudomonas cichorii]MBX8591957.1 hypothetical protein [Pseudomonas cichorii]